MNIRVQTYSGFKADERPTKLILQGRSVNVIEVLATSRGPDEDFFTLLGDDGMVYRLVHERERDGWELLSCDRA